MSLAQTELGFKPMTGPQLAFLARLTTRRRPQTIARAKHRAGVDPGKRIADFNIVEAGRVIAELKRLR